jgi:putative CocE/NonD family hydrolase
MILSQAQMPMTANSVRVMRDVMIRMRDGVHLATDIYQPLFDGKPVSEKLPGLLERTPYDKTGTNHADRTRDAPVALSRPQMAEGFARAGYVVAIQDCRGRYGSEGRFEKYLSEGEDGLDTLAWLREQPWCNGRVATFGLSYGAHTQAALAALNPPGLAAMFLDSGGFSSAFHSGIRQGGAFELKQATWGHKHALLSPETLRDPVRKAALEAEDLRSWFARMPWSKGHSPLRAAPEYEDYLLEQWRSGAFGPYWKRIGLYARGSYDAFADVPMVFMSSWYDPYARTAAENFIGLSRRKRGPVKLLLGPWTHGHRSVSHAGQVDFGAAATLDGNIAPDYAQLRLAWFDRHVKGLPAPDYLPSPVKIFVMGGGSGERTPEGRLLHGGAWRDEQDWPLARAMPTAFFLHDNGKLDTSLPAGEPASRGYDFDPRHPVPTIGGAIASGAPIMEAGAFDQRETPDFFGASAPYGPLSDRDDVLVFQTHHGEAVCLQLGT